MRGLGNHSGNRRPRYLVLLRSVAILHHGVARPDKGACPVLPHQRPRHRFRYPLFLGGADDHDGAQVHGRCPLSRRLHPRPGSGRARREDEQVEGKRHRPAHNDGELRHRRPPLHPGGPRRPRPGHKALRTGHHRIPELRQQALERHTVRPNAPGRLRPDRARGGGHGVGRPMDSKPPEPPRIHRPRGPRVLQAQRGLPSNLPVCLARVLRLVR